MTESVEKDPLLDLFVFETLELIAQLENLTLNGEAANTIEMQINDVFRIVHTVKGSAAMMNFENIAFLSHSLEDALFYIREEHPENADYAALADIMLRSMDFVKNEVNKIQGGGSPDSDVSSMASEINEFLAALKSKKDAPDREPESALTSPEDCRTQEIPGETRFRAVIFFEDGCEMENIRAFNVVHCLEKFCSTISYSPADITENPNTASVIRQKGFELFFSTALGIEEVRAILSDTIFLKEAKVEVAGQAKKEPSACGNGYREGESGQPAVRQKMVSVSLQKLDRLMDLVGELVISQTMVVHNPELEGLDLSSFNKASRQLQKVTNEMQDAVMSIRMVPISVTFQKMNRIVRDMGKKLNKEIKLEMVGENTEVDKNIIEHLSDPLIHLVRNAADHGIEPSGERAEKGKPPVGKITLEARNDGGDVWIIVKDDGKGLDKKCILQKAREHGLLKKQESELTDREIFSCIFLPGFSTKKEVTEFSGRGVGMDVVNKNIEKIGGTIQIDSVPGEGTSISVKIPLTLAIIDGMKVRVGASVFIIPISSIRESFRVREQDVIRDEADKSEMMVIRGECCPVLRLNRHFKVHSDVEELEKGIIVVVENEAKAVCLFADELLGEQQVVVKALPGYVKKVKGISGCTVIGDGKVSLIIDVSGLINSS